MGSFLRRGQVGRRLAALSTAVGLLVGLLAVPAAAAGPYTSVNGEGSSYAGPAFSLWQTDAQSLGLPINYTPTSSPNGLSSYSAGTVPYAGTEAEFSELNVGSDQSVTRGFQYTPDVAGAVAVMYHALDASGRLITYLHLTQRTVARIFMGFVSNWDDPEITAENRNLPLPSHPIQIIYRAGQSGTTALFYNFVQAADPGDFATWAKANGEQPRPISLDQGTQWAPDIEGLGGSDQQASTVANTPWTITYDEFAYAKTYGDQVAWIQNGAGKFTQPYAVNITAALAYATLNANLSQNLGGVYTNSNPLSYPISAYSYIVTQCATNPQFPTCHGAYPDAGQGNTLADFENYVACAGQVHMAAIGYAPLPPNLSQDMANAVGYIHGTAPQTLTAANCANPRFQGLLGVGAAGPPDPFLSLPPVVASSGGASTVGGAAAAKGGSSAAASSAAAPGAGASVGSGPASVVGPGAASSGPGGTGPGTFGTKTESAGGGSGPTRSPRPIAVSGPVTTGLPPWPLLALLIALIVPALGFGAFRRRRATQ